MDEFALIERHFAAMGGDDRDVLIGIGDDAAVIAPLRAPLAVAVDTLVEGVHFPRAIAPADLGYRVAAVNLSDLAAMGAQPRFATLALTLPHADPAWLADFAGGLASALQPSGTALVGGDTTRGPLTVTLQVMGVLHGAPLRRGGAVAGDLVAVSGTLGDARAALDLLAGVAGDATAQPAVRARLLERYFRPCARVALGRALVGLAHAAIDVSDGLIADLGHIAAASAVAIEVEVARLPLSSALRDYRDDATARAYATSGGDDYELAFTFAAADQAAIAAAARAVGVAVTIIGAVTAGRGVTCRDADGRDCTPTQGGYRHFR